MKQPAALALLAWAHMVRLGVMHADSGYSYRELASLTVYLSPQDCGGPMQDCYSEISSAVSKCRHVSGRCNVLLAPGHYRVACPQGAARLSMAETKFPAVSLQGLSNVTFGGVPGRARPQLLIDYLGGGCAAIAAEFSASITVQNLKIDPVRLPFTVGTIVNANEQVVVLRTEVDKNDRLGIYSWNVTAYPFLELSEVGQTVPRGSRATRQLARNGLECPPDLIRCFHSSVDESTGIVTLFFKEPLAVRAELTPGQRVFMKHLGNEFSWGVYGFKVTNFMRVENVSLFSTAGMGFRADFCEGRYELISSAVTIKPHTMRPMSTTADATHWMHHSGHIIMRNSSMQGQGDDGFNVHGNFVVVKSARSHVETEYINEGGAGWIESAPTFMVGDSVQFYSRRSLQPIGSQNIIIKATNTSVVFKYPISPLVKAFDMFLSLKRIASVEVTDCLFGNSNARGVVLSAMNATIINTMFVNLSSSAILLLEGGCGGKAGDYTEGPFARNILLENNSFINTASVDRRSLQNINSLASVQVAGCVPLGSCGWSSATDSLINSYEPTVSLTGGLIRIARFDIPKSATLSSLAFFAASDSIPANVEMALYTDRYLINRSSVHHSADSRDWGYPTKRLVKVGPSSFQRINSGWWIANVTTSLPNGSYFVAHFFPSASKRWTTIQPAGVSKSWAPNFSRGLAPDLVHSHSRWSPSAGLAIAAVWEPVGAWCTLGGTLPPALKRDPAEPNDGGGISLFEPGNVLEVRSEAKSLCPSQFVVGDSVHLLQGGLTFATDIQIRGNKFVAPIEDPFGKPWGNNFFSLGGIDGLEIENNEMNRPAGYDEASAADIVLYNSRRISILENKCSSRGRTDSCILRNESSCANGVTKC